MRWFGISTKKATENLVREAVEHVVRSALGDAESAIARMKEISTLTSEIETLKIEKGRRKEEFAMREREIEHKIGLERKRQEFEIEQAKRETTVTVREENLKADRSRFEEQLKFHEDRFAKEVGYLKEILGDIVKRLPSAEFTADLSGGKRKVRE